MSATVTAAAQSIESAAGSGGLNYLQLILHASLPVQVVMLLLVAASVLSWFIIFGKSKAFHAATAEAFEDFELRKVRRQFLRRLGRHRCRRACFVLSRDGQSGEETLRAESVRSLRGQWGAAVGTFGGDGRWGWIKGHTFY